VWRDRMGRHTCPPTPTQWLGEFVQRATKRPETSKCALREPRGSAGTPAVWKRGALRVPSPPGRLSSPPTRRISTENRRASRKARTCHYREKSPPLRRCAVFRLDFAILPFLCCLQSFSSSFRRAQPAGCEAPALSEHSFLRLRLCRKACGTGDPPRWPPCALRLCWPASRFRCRPSPGGPRAAAGADESDEGLAGVQRERPGF
jgi:hypothetical protein